MILLGLLVISAFFAYWGLTAGLYAVFGRCLMAALAVAAGIGFAGPLRSLIPAENPYLYGPCLAAIAGAAYLLQRALAEASLGAATVSLPTFIDRLGGAAGGFGLGMLGLSYIALVAATLPLPEPVAPYGAEIEQASRVAVATAQAVGTLAGTDVPITLENVLPPKKPTTRPHAADSTFRNAVGSEGPPPRAHPSVALLAIR